MFRRLTLTLFVCVMCCLSLQSLAQNLLTNPGFEDFPISTAHGEGTYIEHGWRYFGLIGSGGKLQVVNPGRNGVGIKLTRTSTSADSGLDKFGTGQMPPAVAGRRYRATVWAKSDAGATLLITIAAHDSAGNWLGQQIQQRFSLTPNYTECKLEYVAPAQTGLFNFAMRVSGTGSLIVDDCELIDITDIPPALPSAKITYPANETVDSFKPTIAFAGGPHSAYQVQVTGASGIVWDSGEVTGSGFTTQCPVALQPHASYSVKVRLKNVSGWGEYSPESPFITPAAPIVEITSPANADQVRGPSVTLKWRAESVAPITAQQVVIDAGEPVNVTPGQTSYTINDLAEGTHTAQVIITSPDGTAAQTSRFDVRITPAPSGTIYYYDMSYTLNLNRSNPTTLRQAYDIPMAVSALQGLVNRDEPRLFVKVFPEDDAWWNRLREPGNWLANKTVVTLPTGINNLHTLFDTFRDYYKGAVLWDENVYATANVACTIAGADDLIPVRYDPASGSIYSRLISAGPAIPVKMDLTGKFTGSGMIWDTNIPSTGSTKNDAYIWARTKYLETGRSNPSLLLYAVDGYYLKGWASAPNPGHTLSCRDYIIQNRGFAVDLSVWADEKPVDDPNQTLGLDLQTFRSILHAAAIRTPGMVEAVGFVPWPIKYTNWGTAGGTHDPVPTEWEYAKWLSYYNAYMDADAYGYVDLANASIYSRFPLPDRMTQNPKLSFTEARKLGYIDSQNQVSPLNFLNLYIGDYDSACWTTRVALGKWTDANRGSVPMSWAFNPNLIRRCAAAYEYYNRTRSANDSFIAGDCGAGYVNPSRLLAGRESGLPSARDIWIQHNLEYFRKTNVKISGFLINGTAGPMGSDVDSMYQVFSGDGSYSQPPWYPQGDHLAGSMPALIQQQDLSGNVTNDIETVYASGTSDGGRFLSYRTILVTPTYVKNLYSGVVAKNPFVPWALVDSRTYASLASCRLGRVPDNRATYTFDTLPDVFYAGSAASGAIGVRNDGWITWNASGAGSIKLSVKWKQGATVVKSATVALPHDVASSKGVVIDVSLVPPSVPGQYTLVYEMMKGTSAFSTLGDYAWEKLVTVNPPTAGGTPAQVKSYANNTLVSVRNCIVTAGTDQLASMFYLEDEDRISAIRVVTGGPSVYAYEGERISLSGTLLTQGAERIIYNPLIYERQPGNPLEPLAMNCRTLGGGDLNDDTRGVTGGSGAHNLGLLVRSWGRVVSVDNVAQCFYMDDGSQMASDSGRTGICVQCKGLAGGASLAMPAVGDYVQVTGINSALVSGGITYPLLRPREQEDIRILYSP